MLNINTYIDNENVFSEVHNMWAFMYKFYTFWAGKVL